MMSDPTIEHNNKTAVRIQALKKNSGIIRIRD